MPESCVTSEIYSESDYKTQLKPTYIGNVISEFPFYLPDKLEPVKHDQDDDFDLERPKKMAVRIEHCTQTMIQNVGLQVWRGALLLADYIIYLGLLGELKGKTVMELGAGTGITSFIASLYANKVICTDIDKVGILDLIKINSRNNEQLLKSQFKVMKLDFTDSVWSDDFTKEIQQVDIYLAADVIYDDDLTLAFITTLRKLLNSDRPKTFYMTLEKRYVFTTEALDSVAPCYETFLRELEKAKCDNEKHKWAAELVRLDFPRFFNYNRVKELILWKIVSEPL